MSDFPEVSEGFLWLSAQGMSHEVNPVSFDDWLGFGNKLWTVHNAIQWAIGDWINYGEAHYGEKYAQALDTTEYSYGTLANYAYVARAFETSRRREKLSWSHHSAVRGIADKQEQDALLDIAESQQMGRDELRDIVKKYKSPDGLLVVGDAKPPYRVIEGALLWDGFSYVFDSDDDVPLNAGKATLHLYEDGE